MYKKDLKKNITINFVPHSSNLANRIIEASYKVEQKTKNKLYSFLIRIFGELRLASPSPVYSIFPLLVIGFIIGITMEPDNSLINSFANNTNMQALIPHMEEL